MRSNRTIKRIYGLGGHIEQIKKKMTVPSWQCSKCQTVYDTDINASVNIRDEGLRLLAVEHLATASRQSVRPSSCSAFRGNVG